MPDQPQQPAGSSWERKAAPEVSQSRRWPWLVPLLVLASAAGYLYWHRVNDREQQAANASIGIRTFTVQSGGRLEKTILLTGQTGPEKYSSLLTPQLRGTRGAGRGTDGSSFNTRSRGGGGGASSGGGGGGGGGGAPSYVYAAGATPLSSTPFVTTTSTAPAGCSPVVHESSVGFATTIAVHGAPPSVTVTPTNPRPRTVTRVPPATGPTAGTIEVMTGALSGASYAPMSFATPWGRGVPR